MGFRKPRRAAKGTRAGSESALARLMLAPIVPKPDFLADKQTRAFIAYLVSCWSTAALRVSYEVHGNGHFLPSVIDRVGGKRFWHCRSLKEASEKYSWRNIDLAHTLER